MQRRSFIAGILAAAAAPAFVRKDGLMGLWVPKTTTQVSWPQGAWVLASDVTSLDLGVAPSVSARHLVDHRFGKASIKIFTGPEPHLVGVNEVFAEFWLPENWQNVPGLGHLKMA